MSGATRAGPARLAALVLLTCCLWPARADNASQEYYTALINVTVQEPGRGAPLTFRIDRGRYGLDSPKAEVRGQVLAPLPIHGGECRAGVPTPRRRQVPHGGRPSAGAEVSVTRSPACSRLGRGLRARPGSPVRLTPRGAFLCGQEACLWEGIGPRVCRDGSDKGGCGGAQNSVARVGPQRPESRTRRCIASQRMRPFPRVETCGFS